MRRGSKAAREGVIDNRTSSTLMWPEMQLEVGEVATCRTPGTQGTVGVDNSEVTNSMYFSNRLTRFNSSTKMNNC